MEHFTKTELTWIESALAFYAKACTDEADTLTGTLKGLALMAGENYNRTADKVRRIVDSDAKRICIE